MFAPIAGLGSIGSTLAAGSVSFFVNNFGLIGLLPLAGALYIVSSILADISFRIAKRGGFEPKGALDNNADHAHRGSRNGDLTTTASSKGECPASGINEQANASGNIFHQAYTLFGRVPVLGALFIEIIVSQCLSSLVNFIYMLELKHSLSNDAARAGWSGKFYAWINGVSGIFQFFAIPLILRYFEAHRIWLFMPILMLCFTTYNFKFQSSDLFGASASFFAMKTMEYSLRGSANEMLYVSLDYESRYLGKKVNSLIAGKFGKSAMAVALSSVMVIYGDEADTMWYLAASATLLNLLWLRSSIKLHSLINASK